MQNPDHDWNAFQHFQYFVSLSLTLRKVRKVVPLFLKIFNLGISHPVLDLGRLTQGEGGSSALELVSIFIAFSVSLFFWYVLTSVFCAGSCHFLFQTFRDSRPNLGAASFCMHLQAAHWT